MKIKKEKAPSKILSLEESISETYGDVMMKADVLKEHTGKFIPTTLSLDIAMNGGLLEGTIMNIGGITMAGKTSLCLETICNAQAMGKECYVADVEHRWQDSLLDCFPRLDKSKLNLIRSTKDKFLTAEDYFRIVVNIFKNKPNVLLVFDSIAALCTEGAYGVQVGESKAMAAIPKLMYDFLRLSPIISANKSNLITITHLQSNPSGYGSPVVEMGGNAIKFFSSYLLRCTKSHEIPEESDAEKTGRESEFKIMKCATGTPSSKGIFYIRYGSGYDREKDIALVGEELGLITKAGAWYKFTPEGQTEEVSKQGIEKLIDYLKENPEVANSLEKSIRTLVFST